MAWLAVCAEVRGLGLVTDGTCLKATRVVVTGSAPRVYGPPFSFSPLLGEGEGGGGAGAHMAMEKIGPLRFVCSIMLVIDCAYRQLFRSSYYSSLNLIQCRAVMLSS